MTPKESFDKFLSQSQGSYLSPWEIWKEATRQAYENAAMICDSQFDLVATGCADKIRQRAKEYDNEET